MRTLQLLGFGVCVLISSFSMAGERPTLLKTCDPRPDILPRPIYDHHTAYRAQYNRPSFVGGWIAYNISRTSLEAMAWQENYCAGNYQQHHMPPVCKTFYYPKPWEALNTASRPDFASNRAKPLPVPTSESVEELKSEESSRKQSAAEAEEAKKADEKEEKSKDERDTSEDKKENADKETDSTIKAAKDFVPSPSDKGK